MQILHVIPITQSIRTEILSYFSIKKVPLGTMVTVPLRKKEIRAIVINSESVLTMKAQLRNAHYQIRNIINIHDNVIFSEEFLQTARCIKNFYVTETGRLIQKILPSFILKNIEKYTFYNQDTVMRNTCIQKILQRDPDDRILFYKTLFQEKITQDESIHIISPNIESCTLLFKQLQKNNGFCFILHSSIGQKKIRDCYKTITNLSKPSLLISTPSFIDTYQKNKTTIIIEEESSEHYHSISSPYIDMRVFIQKYCIASKRNCIWADSIVRPETWYLYNTHKAELIEPYNKHIFHLGDIDIIYQNKKNPKKQTDTERIKELSDDKKFNIISKEALVCIRKAIRKNEKIFLFSHKKSLAPSIVCSDCGNIARSFESGIPFSLYTQIQKKTKERENIFICTMTGESIPAFDICQFCSSWKLSLLGIGTERIFEEIQSLFPKTECYILDGKHTKTKKNLKKVLDSYRTSKKSIIIIGTQKALPYIQNIDHSIIISIESFFSRMSYTIQPQILRILKTIRNCTRNSVILQTRNITETFIPVIQDGLYQPYVEQELSDLKDLNYPPFQTLCVIKKTILKQNIKKEYIMLNTLFDAYNPNIINNPSTKKTYIELRVIFHLSHKIWNTEKQDEKLWHLLNQLDRNIDIYINPEHIL